MHISEICRKCNFYENLELCRILRIVRLSLKDEKKLRSMISINYENKTDKWEPWQKEYKWGAFYLFPPPKVMKTVNALRQKYDPTSAKICDAHVSLSDTIPHLPTDAHISELQDVLGSIKPFTIEYGPLRTYPPYPGVCYDIKPDDKFYQIRETIHSTSLFFKSRLERKNIPPHMTIAEFGLTMEQSDQLCAQLKDKIECGEWVCEGISLAVPDDNFFFKEMLYIPFKS